MPTPDDKRYVSRAGLKLEAALREFRIGPSGWACADLGSHVGGFVDCLLQHGAAKVYAIDTSYGTFAWKLRKDPRVVVMERTNALHLQLPEPVELVTIDVGWTPQELILPIALGLLKPRGCIISLIKPHYEAPPEWLEAGVLPEARLPEVLSSVSHRLQQIGCEWSQLIASPLHGHGGNAEYLALIGHAAP
jgi:23S rRNA (cytidine1920-2'-O)/16S rRNA (cytidine1409-2'-O)-methyltransferase